MNGQDTLARAREVVSAFPVADLATMDEKGYPQLRPMFTLSIDNDFTIYFATGRSLHKTEQISANGKVSVSWSGNEDSMRSWQQVHVKGQAVVSDETSLRHRLWSPALAPYFPGGPDDPDYVLIVIKPVELVLSGSDAAVSGTVEF